MYSLYAVAECPEKVRVICITSHCAAQKFYDRRWLCTEMPFCTVINILAQIRSPRRTIAMRGLNLRSDGLSYVSGSY